MFTGLITYTSKMNNIIKKDKYARISILKPNSFKNPEIGESIAINGICLTLEKFDSRFLYFYASPETMNRTNLKHLKRNSTINIETSLKTGDKIGGHFVYGHIDCMGKIKNKKKNITSYTFTIEPLDKNIMKYIVEKGSIAVDGISLTVSKVFEKEFVVDIIPYTYENTNIKKEWKEGYKTNIEAEMLNKQIYNSVKYFLKNEKI